MVLFQRHAKMTLSKQGFAYKISKKIFYHYPGRHSLLELFKFVAKFSCGILGINAQNWKVNRCSHANK